MSVSRCSPTQYKLSCDGQGCTNHYILPATQQGMDEADDWLTRHGWRTIEGKTHWCRFCSNRVEAFQGGATDDELEQRHRYGRSRQYGRI